MYYIYAYLDPRKPTNVTFENIHFDHTPFYIGKGRDHRLIAHLREAKDPNVVTPKTTKIRKLWKLGLEPIITKIAHFDKENDAYAFEEMMISLIGSDFCPDVEDGSLVNICKSNRPPNHKGKTYEEIYGDKAQEQIEKRRQIQLERGGFGPKKFSDEAKALLSRIQSGTGNGHYGKKHTESAKQKIGLATSKTPMWRHRGNTYTIHDPHDNQYVFFGTLDYFCEINKISRSTLDLNFRKGTVCTRGKTGGWQIISKE